MNKKFRCNHDTFLDHMSTLVTQLISTISFVYSIIPLLVSFPSLESVSPKLYRRLWYLSGLLLLDVFIFSNFGIGLDWMLGVLG